MRAVVVVVGCGSRGSRGHGATVIYMLANAKKSWGAAFGPVPVSRLPRAAGRPVARATSHSSRRGTGLSVPAGGAMPLFFGVWLHPPSCSAHNASIIGVSVFFLTPWPWPRMNERLERRDWYVVCEHLRCIG